MAAEPEPTRLPRRILMTADAVGGVWRYAVDLSTALSRKNIEVVLAVLGSLPDEAQRREIAHIPGLTLHEANYRLEWEPDAWDDVDQAALWLLNLAREFQPDLIHLNGYALAASRWNAPVLVVAHSDVFSWWRSVHRTTPPHEWETYRIRVEAGLQAASCVVAPTRAMGQCLSRDYVFDGSKLTVIPNFSAAPNRGPATALNRRVALAAGRLWDPAKNLSLLEAVAPRLSVPLFVAGGGEPATIGQPEAGSLHCLGKLAHTDLLQQMESATVFVHPALYEPFGLAVLEAAQRGCALVLSDIESLRELWDGAALFLSPRDPEAWVAQLNQLLRDEKLLTELSAAATERAACYTEAQSVEAYCFVYSHLLDTKPRAGCGAAA